MLVSIDGRDWPSQEQFDELPVKESRTLHSSSSPWSDVEIEMWLAPALPDDSRSPHQDRAAAADLRGWVPDREDR
jgi:hypothetical protein